MRDSGEADTLQALQERLGVRFRDEAHLLRALRHRSAALAVEEPRESNERMEFLGDSIVGVVVCDFLYTRFPEASEGDLAKAKAYLVSEPTLAEAGRELRLDEAVELSASEALSGGRMRRSILADTFEAIVAAVYLDQGIRQARRLVRAALREPMRRAMQGNALRDFKSALQERTQAQRRKTPHYKIADTSGAEHDKTFLAQAMLGTKVLGEGRGKSKKEAEQAAARDALEKMK
jgi:ribonuclease III